MEKDLRKRIEEAENDYIGHSFEVDEGTLISMSRQAFQAGAGVGYKEAIELAKEWIIWNIRTTSELEINRHISHIITEETKTKLLAKFESDMNKLWEEKK